MRVLTPSNWRPEVIAALAGFMLFARSLLNRFVGSDYTQILQNDQVHSWAHVGRLLSTDLWSQMSTGHVVKYYRPLFSIALLAQYSLFGGRAWLWHLVSVLLHCGMIVLLALLANRLCGVASAWLATVVFVLHPTHVEAVSWISASNEVCFAALVLLALLALHNHLSSGSKGWAVLSCAAFVAALGFKETAVACLPVLYIAALIWTLDKNRQNASLRWWSVPLVQTVCTTIFFVFRSLVLHGAGVAQGLFGWGEILRACPSMGLFYLQKLLFPVKLSPFYVSPVFFTRRLTAVLIGSFATVVLAVAMAWFVKTGRGVLALGLSLVVFPMFPVFLTMRFYPQGNIVHDRYLYLPTAGLALVYAQLYAAALSHKKLRITLLGFFCGLGLFWAAQTLQQQKFYRDDETAISRAAEIAPRFVPYRLRWGQVRAQEHNFSGSAEEFHSALALRPGNAEALFGLGSALYESKQFREAEPILTQASRANGLSSEEKQKTLSALAHTELNLGRSREALGAADELEVIDPAFPGIHRMRGAILQSQGRLQDAREEYRLDYELTGDAQSQHDARVLSERIAGTAVPAGTL